MYRNKPSDHAYAQLWKQNTQAHGQPDAYHPKSDSSFHLNTKIHSMKLRCNLADYSRETLI